MPKKITTIIKESINFLKKEILKSEEILEILKSEELIKSLETEVKRKLDRIKNSLCLEEGQFHFQRDIAIAEKGILELEELLKSLKTEESVKSLKTKEELKRDRNKTLLFVKEEQFPYQIDIAVNIGRSEKTIRSWIQKYSSNGYKGLLEEKRGGNNTRTISDKAVNHISKFAKMISVFMETSSEIIEFPSKKPFVSVDFGASTFAELLSNFEWELGETIEYDALLSHFRRNHKKELGYLRLYFRNKRKV